MTTSFADSEVEIADGIALVRESLTTLAWMLHNDLKADVFDEDRKKRSKTSTLFVISKVFYRTSRSQVALFSDYKTLLNSSML